MSVVGGSGCSQWNTYAGLERWASCYAMRGGRGGADQLSALGHHLDTDVRPNWIERSAMGAFAGTTIRDVKRKQTRSFLSRLRTYSCFGNMRDSGRNPPQSAQTAARTLSMGGRHILAANSCDLFG